MNSLRINQYLCRSKYSHYIIVKMKQQSNGYKVERKQVLLFDLASISALGADNYLLRCTLPQGIPMPTMYPGQFVQIKVPNDGVLLRRPISVCNVEDNALWLLVARVGRGTEALTDIAVGDKLDIMLPLGNTFATQDVRKPLLVGGGVGIAPMLYLAKMFDSMGIRPDILLGGRSADHLVLLQEFARYGDVYLTTDDGSKGVHGRVTEHDILRSGEHDRIYTCGPKPMMQAVARLAQSRSISCEVSLENTMACGIGACLCCVEDIQEDGNVCVCTEGPVFNARVLKW